jgi:hypothetical protein
MRIDPDVTARELIDYWLKGHFTQVADALAKDHPALTALVMLEGLREKSWNVRDCNILTNLLIDRRITALHKQDEGSK